MNLLRLPPCIVIVIAVFFCSNNMTTSFSFEPMSQHEKNFVLARLTPLPVEVALGANDVLLDDQLEIVLTLGPSADQQVSDWVKSRFAAWFKSKPQVRMGSGTCNFENAEEYAISATGKKLEITALTMAGVRYALYTLRQLAEVVPGTKTVQGWFIPELRIKDRPALKFRGLHLCWMPETPYLRVEQAIRLAAYYKINYVVLEFWGVYPYKSLSHFGWAELKTSEDEVRKLVKIGKELGVTLIPQFNLFGHASASRNVSGKHALLDLHPEYASLFEPDGWTWCLSNKETRKVLDAIVLELIDVFDQPEFFHLGCDEAYSAGSCKLCRRANYIELLHDHLCHFNDLLKSKKSRPLIWHDMLLQADSRWKNNRTSESASKKTFLERIPKDFIICDWQYGSASADGTWPTMQAFKAKGFDVMACPWRNLDGIRSQAKEAIRNNYYGVLCTSWNYFFTFDMYRNSSNIYVTGATALWGTQGKTVQSEQDIQFFNYHLRQIGWDMNGLKYKDVGTHVWQVTPNPTCP